ncbi:MAG: acetyl-CoA carboxylase biotin carboxyl carrier protein subunit, partial [Bacteroidota bacterium]
MYIAKIEDREYEVLINRKGITLNGEHIDWDISQLNTNSYHIIKNSKSFNVELENWDIETKKAHFKINGQSLEVEVKDKLDLLLKELGMDKLASAQVNDVKAPMPGLILSMSVEEGQEVKKG